MGYPSLHAVHVQPALRASKQAIEKSIVESLENKMRCWDAKDDNSQTKIANIEKTLVDYKTSICKIVDLLLAKTKEKL